MSTLDILLTMRAILATPDKWTKGAYARADDYTGVFPDDPHAGCFCPLGALERACPGTTWEVAVPTLRALHRHVPEGYASIADWNDDPSTTHAGVLAVLDATIAYVRWGSHALRRGDSGHASASRKNGIGRLRGRRRRVHAVRT